MNGKAHTIRRTLQALVLTATVATITVPVASAGNGGGAGLVPSRLGSPDPRESHGKVLVSQSSVVARQLGSQDPRDTAAESVSQSSIVARQLGSQDPRDTASQVIAESSVVASELGTPDTRDAAGVVAQPAWLRALQIRGEGMNKLYGNVQPGWLRALQIRGEGMNELYADGNTTPVGNVTSSDGGINFGNVGIGIVGAVCGLLLLTALGIGARQVRHTRHRLGSA
jgi:hypothetical protein